jgi:hypothetical protein
MALRHKIDPGEFAMAAVPLGWHGRRPVPGVAPEGTVPLGFADAQEFAAFGATLTKGLADSGYGDAVPVFQGSAVTGVKFTSGEPFDAGRRSDFDIAIADARLSGEAEAMGVRFRSRPPRTEPLTDKHLRLLGLKDLIDLLSTRSEREVHVMIYRDVESALQRAGGIRMR